jgi:uroporphyrinogen-III synthase
MRVLVTRPAEDSARTAAALEAAGHEALVVPLFAIRPREHAMPGQADGFIATSANALRHARLTQDHFAIPIFVVGDATADEASRCGFRTIHSARGNGHDLAMLLTQARPEGGHFIYLAGVTRRDDALRTLDERFMLQIVETYDSVAVDAMPGETVLALKTGQIDAILHFSTQSAAVFATLAQKAGLAAEADEVGHVFISAAAETPGYAISIVAERPDLAAMIDALARV